jgi:hypothetical protein
MPAINKRSSRNSLTEQEAIFCHLVSTGVPAAAAAQMGGYAAPRESARLLLLRPAIRATLADHAAQADLDLGHQSRFVLKNLLESGTTPDAVKGRIALELLKRDDSRAFLTKTPKLDSLSEATIENLILVAQARLTGPVIDQPPDDSPEDRPAPDDSPEDRPAPDDSR